MEIYLVTAGDTLDSIAEQFTIATSEIAYINQIPYPYRLAIGQALLLPTDDTNLEVKKQITVNGYAYPYISNWILAETLPYLTEISIFSYGFTVEGNLLPPVLDEQWIINTALAYQTNPLLTLTPLDENGQFNNYLIHEMVQSSEARQNLIYQLLDTLLEKGYQGVDIDFEYILAIDRDAFTQFVDEATQFLNTYGYQVSVALAPKTSATQTGLLYEGKDYQALGEVANRVLLMTYEWGYAYSEPMAVAPINQVRRVVEYAVTEINPEKIHLGIPNYGYDWSLPYISGQSRAQTIGCVQAIQIAIENNAVIQYDEVAQTPWFVYEKEGINHEVWFEDVRSLQAKFNLIKEFNLLGAGYWQIMRYFRANWILLEDTFIIKHPSF